MNQFELQRLMYLEQERQRRYEAERIMAEQQYMPFPPNFFGNKEQAKEKSNNNKLLLLLEAENEA